MGQQRLSRTAALNAHLAAYRAGPFAWGTRDCLRFGFEGHTAAGGRDLTVHIPPYRTRLGALRALTALGFANLGEALGHFAAPIPAAQGAVGDIAWQAASRLGAVGIVLGAESVFFSALGAGFVRLPTRALFVFRS